MYYPFPVLRAEKESKGFGARSPAPVEAAPKKAKAMSKQDLKWQLQPYDVPEWIQWVDAQKIEAGVSGAACLPFEPAIEDYASLGTPGSGCILMELQKG